MEAKERVIPESKMSINPVLFDDSFRSMKKPAYLPDTISTEKLVTYLKSAKVSTTGMPDNHYLYATGRNILADLLLVAIHTGEFDENPAQTL
jgi:hypothetical protein